jgi:predicted HTH transcriptional regulator
MIIADLLSSPEGKTLEFKRDLSSPTPILKTLVAFANSAGGIRFTVMLPEILPLTREQSRATLPTRAQSGAQSGAQSTEVLQALWDSVLSSHEIAEVIGLESRSGALKRTIKDLLENSLIEMTIPEKPNSRLQKYRLTEKGRERKLEG